MSNTNKIRYSLNVSGGNLSVSGGLLATGNSNTVGALITTGGNVGIGISSPAAKLDIIGGSGFDGSGGSPLAAFSYWGEGFRHFIKTRHNTSTSPDNGNAIDIYLNNSNLAGGSSTPGTGNLLGMSITSFGVGIGTSSPNAKLDVSGDLLFKNQFRMESTEGSMKFIGTGNATYIQSGLNLDSDSKAPLIFTSINAGTEYMRITTSGNLGIGISSPTAKLDVSGNVRITSGSLLATGNSNTIGSLFTTGGNVGIGVTNPNAPLVIQGNTTTGILKICNNTDAGGDNWWIGFNHNNDTLDNRDRARIGASIAPGGSGRLFFTTGAPGSQTERILIDENGNVGIGTTSPGSKLHVRDTVEIGYGSSSTPGNEGTLIIGGANGSSAWRRWQFKVGGTGSTNYNTNRLRIIDSNTERMTIDDIGNVGIGTTSPEHKLQINDGNLYLNGENRGFSVDAQSFSRLGIVKKLGTTTKFVAGSTTIMEFAHSSEQNILTNISGATLTTRLAINTAGNIGIGTTNPNSRLHVGNGGILSIDYGAGIDAYASGHNYTKMIYPMWDGSDCIKFFTPGNGSGAEQARISADGYIRYRVGHTTISDSRIKKNIQDINDSAALIAIRQIEPKIYNYIEETHRTSEKVYGFLAQQVAQVIPYAVKISDEAIPNVYEHGIFSINTDPEGTVTASVKLQGTIPFDLQNETTTRLQISKLNKETDYHLFEITSIDTILNIITLKDNEKNTLKNFQNESEVFVYGSTVSDFHSLNKEVIFTVATAALQEVDRQLQTEKQAHAATSAELSETKEELQTLKIFLQNKFPGEI